MNTRRSRFGKRRRPLPLAATGGRWRILACLLLAGCAPAVKPPHFAPREQIPLAGMPTGEAGWPAPDWWRQYQDPQLERLIRLALQQAPSLEQAQARYLSASREVDVQRAQLGPTLDLEASGAHGSGHLHGPDLALETPSGRRHYNLNGSRQSNYGSATLIARWDLDLWGKQKAAVAAAIGEARAALADTAAASNALETDLAATYFDWQTQESRRLLARRDEQAAGQLKTLTDARVQAGIDEPSMGDQAADRLAQARQLSAQLAGKSALDRVQLAALAGVSPAALNWLHAKALPEPDTRLPPDARLGLIARRPDIAAARWRIEAAQRQIDRARAAYYPDVSLLGLGGYLSMNPSLGSGVRVHGPLGSIGPSISLPLFESGRLKAQVKSAQAALDTAVAAYNATIVKAAHEIAQQIAYLAQQQGERQQQVARIEAISHSSQRSRDQYQRGLLDERTLLNDQLQLNQLHDTEQSLQGQLLNTQLQMIHALGGGYLTPDLPALPASSQEAAR